MDEEAGEIVSVDIVSGSDKYKTGEITHGVHEIRFAAIVGDLARGPEVDVKDVEGTAKGPRKDELTVAFNSAGRSDTVGTAKNPLGNVLAAEGPEEAETNAMEGFVDAHVASRRGRVVGGEDITTERGWNDDKHQHFLVILDGLEDDELAIKEGESVAADVIAISVMKREDVSFGEGGRCRETVE